MDSKLNCPLLYNHIALNNLGQRVFCCISDYSPEAKGVDIFDPNFSMSQTVGPFEERVKEARASFSAGQFPKECRVCEKAEKLGKKSFRQTNLEVFNHTAQEIAQGKAPTKIEYIDIKLGNHCNLKCRMCNPYNSHALKQEFEEIYPGSSRHTLENDYNWFRAEGYFNQFRPYAKDLKVLLFTGGEPFINTPMWQFIDYLIVEGHSKNIHLKYNTNFLIYNEDIHKKLLKFKKVTLYLSIDGTEDVFEYIRYPGKWSQIEANLKLLNELCHFEHNIETVFFPSIQVLNILNLDKVINLPRRYPRLTNNTQLNLVTKPDYYSISNLPKSCKAEARLKIMDDMKSMLQDMLYPDQLFLEIKGVLELLKEESHPLHMREFLRVNNIFDKSRQQDLKGLFPSHWLDHYLSAVNAQE